MDRVLPSQLSKAAVSKAEQTTVFERTADVVNRMAGVAFGRGRDGRQPSHGRQVIGQSGQPIFPVADISVSLSVLGISPQPAR